MDKEILVSAVEKLGKVEVRVGPRVMATSDNKL